MTDNKKGIKVEPLINRGGLFLQSGEDSTGTFITIRSNDGTTRTWTRFDTSPDELKNFADRWARSRGEE